MAIIPGTTYSDVGTSAEPEPSFSDPVQLHEMWQATCDACGWHTQPASPRDAVREWARLHRVTCPLKTGG